MKKKIENRNDKLIAHWNPKSSIAESYRTLRTNIQFASIGKEVKSILVTSTQPGEGKTTTAANLAVVMGQAGKNTVYVDGDLRRPTGWETFQLHNLKGVTSYLVGNDALDDIIQTTDIPNLSIITSGPIPPNPAELLGSKEMGQFIEELKTRFDMVIIDSAPSLAVADPAVLSTHVDGCLLVISSGKTNDDLAEKVKKQLEMVNANILGVVLNNMPRSKKEAGYYYYESKEPVKEKELKKKNQEPATRTKIMKQVNKNTEKKQPAKKTEVIKKQDHAKSDKTVENFRRKINNRNNRQRVSRK